ncbi:flavodoxin-dependent (E)-4-hydroxy-3-methylbut-2-enyl-diphosphate synthase [bacterium]|nr:flavodoxin-dependent (E)-4-hydroxy-3-methylbut-2-enyl-diphosphate synthase [bacterium]
MRRLTKEVRIGNVKIGGGNPIAIQSMTRAPTKDVKSVVEEIKRLELAGCEIVRVAVPDEESVEALKLIKNQISLPLVADIHFNWHFAIRAIELGVDKIRINPGTIKNKEGVKEIVKRAKEKGIPIRVGVNAGSLPKDLAYTSLPQAMVEAALREIQLLEELDFTDIIVSLKAFDIQTTVEAYERLAETRNYPLHIGITEAGPMPEGAIRSAVGLGILLSKGLGDTVRVSLTADAVKEVEVAWEILQSLNLRKRGFVIVSCPMCARCSVPLIKLVQETKEHLAKLTPFPIKIAIMGCEVNGPGEAKEADIGLAFGKTSAVIFIKGNPIKTVSSSEAIPTLLKKIEQLLSSEDFPGKEANGGLV